MQLALDELYAASVKGQRFCNLVELIKRPENIKLAYRNIRKNSGSRTAGVDNKTISDLNKWNENALVAHVQRKLDWYVPNAVRRVEIPKDNGENPSPRNTHDYGQAHSAMYSASIRTYL